MDNQDKRIDDIVAMLDGLTSSNVEHINITIDQNSEGKSVKQANSLECASGNLACSVPTFFDNNED